MPTLNKSRVAGFTLVELMVVIVIATILITIAVPSYMNQTRHAKRTDAKTALLDLAAREERYMATNSAYTSDGPSLGYGSAFPITLQNNDYTIAAPTVTAANLTTSPPTPAAFTATATAVNQQAKDTACYTYTVNNLGQQTSTDNSSNTTSGCW
ncbi:MAG TPA: type IV pilin protein [Steroidobacteraceae bacterium]|nr:type IV pilin protein [Steroidobacteraceae bacterium]